MNAHWPVSQLGEVFEIARGGSPRPIEKFITDDERGLNWIKIGDASASGKYIEKTKEKITREGLSKTRYVEPGDFLLTNSMSFGRPYIMATSGCIHDGWLVLKPKLRDSVNPDYFYHLLGSETLYRQFEARAGGSTVKNLNSEIVSSIEIRLPPLEEQRRIAAILDKADALQRKRSRAIALLESLSQSIFLEMFGGLIDRAPNERHVRALGEVGEIVSGITKGRKLNGEATREVPYLAVSNVQDKFLNLTAVKTIEATEAEIKRYLLKRDDLLLTEGGDPDKLGRGTLWADELSESIHQNHIFRVRVTSSDVLPLYLIWLLGSAYGKAYFLRSAKQTTGIASINKTQLSEFPVILPTMEAQREFREKVHLTRRAIEFNVSAGARLYGLFSSLQSRAFSGQL